MDPIHPPVLTRRCLLQAAGATALAVALPGAGPGAEAPPPPAPAGAHLASRPGTVAWSGDLVVVGASLAGLAVALAAAGEGRRVLLLADGPVLGEELCAAWDGRVPTGWLADLLAAEVARHGGVRDGWFDPCIAALAWDRLVERQGVAVLLCVTALRPHRGAGGVLAGVEFVGKGGRQLAAAPAVVDATLGGAFAAAVCGRAAPRATACLRRIHLHGVAVNDLVARPESPCPGIAPALEVQPGMWPDEAVVGFRLAGELPAGAALGARSHHLAVALARSLHRQHPACARARLVDIAPVCALEHPAAEPLPALAGTGLEVAAGREALLAARPAAVACAARALAGGGLPLPAQDPVGAALDGGELAPDPAYDDRPATLAALPLRVHPAAEVVVAGCGTGGSFAALAAAQEGARVAVLDMHGIPGGIGTASRVNSYYMGVKAGMRPLIDERAAAMRDDLGRTGDWHPSAKADVLLDALEQAGVQVETGLRLFGVVREGVRVTGVLAAGADGAHLFPCRVAVDGTGDGDLAAAAGARWTRGRASDGVPLFYSLNASQMRNGEVARHGTVGWTDPTDAREYTRAHVEGRAALWRQGPFTPAKHFCTLAPLLGIRQSRAIAGEATVTAADFLAGRVWDDAVAMASANFDVGGDFALEGAFIRHWVVAFGLFKHQVAGQIPYRSLLPAGIEGVLMACRAYSAEPDLQYLARMQSDMQQLGEAAGTAAALAVRSGCTPGGVDRAALRERLRLRGLLPAAPVAPAPDRPAADLLAALGGAGAGLAMLRLADGGRADAPDWDAFLAAAPGEEARFRAAVVAALRGEPHPVLMAGLRSAVEARSEGLLLGERSSPRWVVAAYALALAGDDGVVGRIAALLALPDLSAADSKAHRTATSTELMLQRALGAAGGTAAAGALRARLAAIEARPASVERDILALAALRELAALDPAADLAPARARRGHPRLLLRRQARRLAGA
jgi:hypothetical protein